jgi:chorismate mutase/prephenate dehydratase
MTLDDLRAEIDAIDDQLLTLLAKRADLVPKIIEAKKALGMRTVDPEREQAILDRLAERGAGAFPSSAVRAVFREIMSGSVSLQRTIRVAFLGPEGTYSHLAARQLFGFAPTYLEESTIAGVVDSVRRGRADHGVVPLENSTEGAVTTALDALLEGGCLIRREHILPIEHCLMARASTLAGIRRVYSHPQALAQCRGWLSESLPQAQLVHTASTTAAVREALADAEGGAIGSAFASELMGLPILRERVQDQHQNATRFAMISAQDAKATGQDKTTLAFAVGDDLEQGALRRTLEIIEKHGVSLTRIESRPRPGEAWRYLFIADLEGHRTDPAVAGAIADLEASCAKVLLLGSYPRAQ